MAMAAGASVLRPLIGVAWDLPLCTFQDKKFVVLSICGLSKVWCEGYSGRVQEGVSMARIRGVTTIVPSTDTAWSVKPHNNKEAADVGDLAQARKAELQHHSPMEKRSLECHPWIQGAAERQTVSPITSRQSRNKRPLVYVRVAQDRCLPTLQPEADFIPVWLSLGPVPAIHTIIQPSIPRRPCAPTTDPTIAVSAAPG